MIERFRARGEAASDRAARLGSQALKLGAGYGNDALARVSSEVENCRCSRSASPWASAF